MKKLSCLKEVLEQEISIFKLRKKLLATDDDDGQTDFSYYAIDGFYDSI